jgi:mono/diheme cytochrome c family protein
MITELGLTGGFDPTTGPARTPAPPAAAAAAAHAGRRWTAVVLALGAAIALGWAGTALALYKLAGQPARTGPQAHARAPGGEPPDGRALYAQNCASCHGVRGDGTGITAASVWPRPRNFGEGLYRLKTTTSGMPTDEDLMRVVQNGIPGSAMPAFPDLTADERRALAAHVRDLTRAGIYARLRQKAEQDGGIDLAEVADAVQTLSQVGPVLDVPDRFPPATPESVANGRRVYLATCAQCHGPEGHGDGPQVATLKNADGTPTRPRDLTAGSYKGGGEHGQLYTRILIGMPGTPMPASTQLKPDEIGDLINYVRSLPGPRAAPAVVTAAGPDRPGPGTAGGPGGR